MKHTKTELVPAKLREVQTHVTCDLCNHNIDEDNRSYDVDLVTIHREVGKSYPGGPCIDGFEVDLCGKCLGTKLVPWLASQGAFVRKSKEHGQILC